MGGLGSVHCSQFKKLIARVTSTAIQRLRASSPKLIESREGDLLPVNYTQHRKGDTPIISEVEKTRLCG